jgi:predicted nucleic acid-binding protein
VNALVLDASITLSWCFPDEQAQVSLTTLDRLKTGDVALVPSFWCVEVLNALLVGERRGRISIENTKAFLRNLEKLRPAIDHVPFERITGSVQDLCRRHGLSPYDAIYVELAMREQVPLATLDQAQREAARAIGVTCL